jgi:SNF2 family DNA or RNA helicase
MVTVDAFRDPEDSILKFAIQGVLYEDKERLKGLVKGIKWDGAFKVWKVPAAIWHLNDLTFLYPDLKLINQGLAWTQNIYQNQQKLFHVKQLEDVPEFQSRWSWAFPHQRVDSKFHLMVKRSEDWSEPGTGKTLKFIIVGIESGSLDKEGHAIVVCPNSAKYNWRNEIRDAQHRIGLNYPVFVHTGDVKTRRGLTNLMNWVEFGGWMILNWESLRILVQPDQKKKTHGILLDALLEKTPKLNYLVADESHKGKNRDSAQTEALDYLSQFSDYQLEGTGTPITVKPDDLWAGLHRLYPNKFSSYWWFVDRYCNVEIEEIYIKGGAGATRTVRRIEDGYNERNLNEFNTIAATLTVRRRFEEVVKDVPEKQYKVLPVELNPQQEKLYKMALEEWFKVLRYQGDEELVPIPNVISQITYLRQILLDPNIVGFDTGYTPAKTALLLDRLRDLDDKPIVVMSKFVKYINRLEEVVKREGYSYMRITGAEKPEQRQSNVEAFQAGKVRVALCGIDASGVALTLTRAAHMEFTDRDWTKALNDQAEGRIRRIGQRSPQFFSIYTVEGTVDDRIERSNATKGAFENAFVNKTGAMTVKDLKKLLRGGD